MIYEVNMPSILTWSSYVIIFGALGVLAPRDPRLDFDGLVNPEIHLEN